MIPSTQKYRILAANYFPPAVAVAASLGGLHAAVGMLHQRVRVVRDYVAAVQAGTVPANPALLRDAAALCQRLPVIDLADRRFATEFMRVGCVSYEWVLVVFIIIIIFFFLRWRC